MKKLLIVENDWDSEPDCPEVMGPCCLLSEEEVAAAIKGLKIGKADDEGIWCFWYKVVE